jgi:hypothetical protein
VSLCRSRQCTVCLLCAANTEIDATNSTHLSIEITNHYKILSTSQFRQTDNSPTRQIDVRFVFESMCAFSSFSLRRRLSRSFSHFFSSSPQTFFVFFCFFQLVSFFFFFSLTFSIFFSSKETETVDHCFSHSSKLVLESRRTHRIAENERASVLDREKLRKLGLERLQAAAIDDALARSVRPA